jgi:hypothetical protein
MDGDNAFNTLVLVAFFFQIVKPDTKIHIFIQTICLK